MMRKLDNKPTNKETLCSREAMNVEVRYCEEVSLAFELPSGQ